MRLLILLAGAMALISCQMVCHLTPEDKQEAKILQIAKQAVRDNDTWIDRAEFDRPKKDEHGNWSVYVERKPSVSGGYRLIIIGKDGKLLEYMRGM